MMIKTLLTTIGLAVVLLALPAYVLRRLDARAFRLLLRASAGGLLWLVAAAGALWLVLSTGQWPVCVGWTLLTTVLASALIVRRARQDRPTFWLPIGFGVLVATGAVALLVTWALPMRATLSGFVVVLAVLQVGVVPMVAAGLQAYCASKRATQAHQEYLLGNGASRLESLLPSVSRGLRAVLAAGVRSLPAGLPLVAALLLGGQLLTHVGLAAAVATTLLLLAGMLAAAVGSLLLALWLAEQNMKQT